MYVNQANCEDGLTEFPVDHAIRLSSRIMHVSSCIMHVSYRIISYGLSCKKL